MQSHATETNQILWFYSFFRFSIWTGAHHLMGSWYEKIIFNCQPTQPCHFSPCSAVPEIPCRLTDSDPENAWNWILVSPIIKISGRSMPPDPPPWKFFTPVLNINTCGLRCERCESASWTSAYGTSKCYRRNPCGFGLYFLPSFPILIFKHL